MSTATARPILTIDECVRTVTAFGSFKHMTDTQPSYAPTIYTRGFSAEEKVAARRVVDALSLIHI